MATSHRLGVWGESVALAFLQSCGYRCLDRRFRLPGGEIDLVMRDRGILVFVEVKTRSGDSLAPAEAWLGRTQLVRLRRMALAWLDQDEGQAAADLRFDLVAVEHFGREQGASLRHFVGVG